MILKKCTIKHREICFFAVLFIAMLTRFFAFGFKYFPYLDDYIQYDVYKMFDAKYVFLFIGTIFTRPLASIFDYYVWSPLWNNMAIALFVIITMHFFSAYFLNKCFKEVSVTFGVPFYVFFFFVPFVFEGIYWISASSRIVSGIFFASLSLFFLVKNKTFLFAIFNLISYLFYEQAMIFSFIVAIYFCLKKDKSLIIIPVTNAVICALFYLIFLNQGRFSLRNELTFSTSFIYGFIDVIKTFDFSLFLKFDNILFVIISVIFSFLLCFLGEESEFNKEKLILGVLIATCPFLPYLFLKSIPNFRNTVFLWFGIGLIFDLIKPRKIYTVCIFLVCTLFINTQLIMLENQKSVYETDTKILTNIAPYINENKTYCLIGAKERYNASYTLNITSSHWALSGALRSFCDDKNITFSLGCPDCENEKLYIDNFLEISK